MRDTITSPRSGETARQSGVNQGLTSAGSGRWSEQEERARHRALLSVQSESLAPGYMHLYETTAR